MNEWQSEGDDSKTVRLRPDLVITGNIVPALSRLIQKAQLADIGKTGSDEPTTFHALIGDVTVEVNGRTPATKMCFAYLRASKMPHKTVVGLDLRIEPKY
jgi:hypothetical protein